jgi:hypothetical protein
MLYLPGVDGTGLAAYRQVPHLGDGWELATRLDGWVAVIMTLWLTYFINEIHPLY